MPSFLVEIVTRMPPDMPVATREAVQSEEIARVHELHRTHAIERIWRVPGKTASVGIWRAADADDLHTILTSLPLFPWLQIEVRALATHFLEND